MADTVGELKIALTFDNGKLKASQKQVEAQIESTGKSSGGKFGGAWAVAAGNLITSGIKKIGSVISSSLGSAIARTDTLNNYPKVMESLGYSSEQSAKSVNQISDALDGLPSTLDGVISDTQKLAATMGNLADGEVNATSVTLGLNDMFLAGGKGTEAASRAMEQYNQMLAAGRVDQQSWNSMLNAAPGQLDQLAKSMLGATANQKDLYNALKDGTVSFDDMNAAIVRLDKEGSNGIASFNEQAVAGTQGIATQLQNIQTSMTKVVSAALDGNEKDMNKYLKQLVNRITKVVPQIAKAIAMAVPAIVGILPELIMNIITALEPHIDEIINAIIDGLMMLLDHLPELIAAAIKLIIAIGVAIIQRLPEIIGKILMAIIQLIPVLVEGIVNAIGSFFGPIGEAIGNFFSGVWEGVVAGAQAVWEGIQAVFSGIAEWFGNIFRNAWAAVKAVFETGGKIFSGIVEGIIATFKTVVNGIISGINTVVAIPFNAINGFLNILKSIDILGFKPFDWVGTIAVPQIPLLAQGGYASGATGAVIGEAGAEVVLPLSQNTDNWSGLLASALAEKFNEEDYGAGRGIVIENQNFNIDSRLDAENIGHIMMQSIRRQAR